MKKPILITGFVPGYPNSKATIKIAQTLVDARADILELSASFSEPVADGPTLQLAHQRVLKTKFSKSQAFALYKKIAKLRNGTEPAASAGSVPFHPPLFLIEYANIIYKWGFDRYYKAASRAGINYLAVPDLPIEESAPFIKTAKKYGIAQIFLVAPTTPDKRVKEIIKAARVGTGHCPVQTDIRTGQCPVPTDALNTFLYLVSITGVTGSRKDVSCETLNFIKRVRKLTKLPLIVGFGISSPQHIKQVLSAGANGVVTCSKIVDIIHQKQTKPAQMLKSIQKYVKNLKNIDK